MQRRVFQNWLAVGLAWVAACGGATPSPLDPPRPSRPTVARPAPMPFWRSCDDSAVDVAYAAQLLAVDARVQSRLVQVQNNRGIFVSEDGGLHWDRATPEQSCHVAVDAVLPYVALPDALCLQLHSTTSPYYAEIYCQSQGGLRRVEVPAGYEDFAGSFISDPAQPRRIFATLWGFGCPAGSGESPASPCETLAWSPDAGRLWLFAPAQRAMHLQLALSRGGATTLYVAHSARGPRFTSLQACDAGLTCVAVLEAGQPGTFANLAHLEVNAFNGDQLLLDWGDDGTWISGDRGRTSAPVRDAGEFVDPPQFVDGQAPWGTLVRTRWGQSGRVLLRSRDGGQSWEQAASDLPAEAGDIVPGTAVLYFTSPAGLFASRDLGDTWQALPLPDDCELGPAAPL